MGDLWYGQVRTLVIQVNGLGELCDLAALVKTEILSELQTRPGAAGDPLPAAAARVLQDIQERVIFRAQTHLTDEIGGFYPSPEDLDYPAKLIQAASKGASNDDGDGQIVVQSPAGALNESVNSENS